MMAKRSKQKLLSLRWPLGGLDERWGYQDQRPYTTPSCSNVFPTSQDDGRERGGSRPGLSKAVSGQVSGGNKVNMLATVHWVDSGVIKSRLVASCNGNLKYTDDGAASWSDPSVSSIDSDRLVHATEHLQKLYIATDGHPKYYDPSDNSSGAMEEDDADTVPHDCLYTTTWNDRVVFAGSPSDPHNWHMSRQGDATDWTTAQLDTGSPVSGNASDAGYLAEPVNALIPHGNDCLIFGCENSIWALHGDPAAGGRIVNLSRNIGMLDGKAWAKVADSTLYFMSNIGLCRMENLCGSQPKTVSIEKVPTRMQFIDDSSVTVLLEYDMVLDGLHIFLSNNSDSAATHYFMDFPSESFWPVSLGSTNCDPFSICRYPSNADEAHSDVMIGCRDGYVRQYDKDEYDDDGNEFSSHVTYGPMRLGSHGIDEGIIQRLDGVLETNSGEVTWEVFASKTFEGAADVTATAEATGTWDVAGLNYAAYPRVRGAAFSLKLTHGTADDGWAVEEVNVTTRDKGKRRAP